MSLDKNSNNNGSNDKNSERDRKQELIQWLAQIDKLAQLMILARTETQLADWVYLCL